MDEGIGPRIAGMLTWEVKQIKYTLRGGNINIRSRIVCALARETDFVKGGRAGL